MIVDIDRNALIQVRISLKKHIDELKLVESSDDEFFHETWTGLIMDAERALRCLNKTLGYDIDDYD